MVAVNTVAAAAVNAVAAVVVNAVAVDADIVWFLLLFLGIFVVVFVFVFAVVNDNNNCCHAQTMIWEMLLLLNRLNPSNKEYMEA